MLENKISFQFSKLTSFSLKIMATLRNKRKLAAVSRETPENKRNNQSQNTLNAETAEDYITQVSEETEGGSLKTFPRKLAGRSHAFCVLYLDLMNFFWTRKYGLIPEPF